MISDREAELIARHIVKLMRKDLIAVALQTKQQVAESATEEIMNSQEAAEFLRMSPYTFKRKISEIPCHQKGAKHKRIYLRSELLSWRIGNKL